MLNFIDRPGAYPADVVAVMVAAFDKSCQSLPKSVSESADMRRKLAWIIIGYVDRGERDPVRLCKLAINAIASERGDGQVSN